MSNGTAIEPFDFNGNPIRVAMIDGEPWFVAADVCKVLEISNPADAVRRLDADEYQLVNGTIVSTDGGPGRYVVNESGLYSFTLGSRKSEAKVFKRWVTGEVLPQIRRTGAYGVQRELTRRELIMQALEAEDAREAAEAEAKLWEERARDERAVTARQQVQLEEAAPKTEAFEELISAEGCYSLAKAAQILKLGRDRLIERLGELKMIIIRPGHSDHLRPYQAQIHAGRFVVKARTFHVIGSVSGQDETRTEGTTYVTPKGLTHIRQLLHG